VSIHTPVFTSKAARNGWLIGSVVLSCWTFRNPPPTNIRPPI